MSGSSSVWLNARFGSECYAGSNPVCPTIIIRKKRTTIMSASEQNKYGEGIWKCKPCNWFIYPSALKFQETIGTQSYPWRCPECKRLLTEEEK